MTISSCQTKKIIFYLFTLLLILAITECCFFVVYLLTVKDIRSQPNKIFSQVSIRNDEILGWRVYDGQPRPSTNPDIRSKAEPCVYVFGDSFSHADEVTDYQAWPNLVEKKIGCPVFNFGVSGYGTDQAYLALLQKLPKLTANTRKRPIVLFGIYQDMLKRNMAASWLFYCCYNLKNSIKPFFTLNESRESLLLKKLPENYDTKSISIHHSSDRYYQLYRIDFPYTISLVRNLYYRINRDAFDRVIIEPYEFVYEDEDGSLIQFLIMQEIRKVILERGYELGFIFFPTPHRALSQQPPYSLFLERLPLYLKDDKHVFTIDTHRSLYKISRRLGELVMPKGHFDAIGNSTIADDVVAALSKKVKM